MHDHARTLNMIFEISQCSQLVDEESILKRGQVKGPGYEKVIAKRGGGEHKSLLTLESWLPFITMTVIVDPSKKS